MIIQVPDLVENWKSYAWKVKLKFSNISDSCKKLI